MRTIVKYVFVLITLSSCSKYQFVTISSDFKKSEKGAIIIENDTFAVKYSFSGANGPVSIQVINRLSVPLYVKWHPSSLIKKTWPNSPSRPILSASVNSVPVVVGVGDKAQAYCQVRYTEEVFSSPARSLMKSNAIPIRKAFFHISTPEMRNGELNGDRIRSQYFSRQNTPLILISELTVSTSKDFTNSSTSKHEFWVDEVFITMIQPQRVRRYNGRDDMFYLRKGSGLGIFLATIGFFTYFAASQASE
jgi:hypothetical protein